MKNFGLILVVLGLALAAAPAVAQGDACQTSFTLRGTSPDNVWHVGDQTNPTLTACPGQEITVTANSESGVHNFGMQGVDGAPPMSDIIDEGQSITYTFTAPASGSGTYICQLHAGTMKGTMNFAQTGGAGSDGGDNGGGDNDSPGVQVVGVAIALLGAALILGRRTK